jgi:hypothetical protein
LPLFLIYFTNFIKKLISSDSNSQCQFLSL